jgi:hypothetical protein
VCRVIRGWKEKEIKEIRILRNKDIKTLIVPGDQAKVTGSENTLQISVHKLETITSKYESQISKSKTKGMAFKERDPVRSKIVINVTLQKSEILSAT